MAGQIRATLVGAVVLLSGVVMHAVVPSATADSPATQENSRIAGPASQPATSQPSELRSDPRYKRLGKSMFLSVVLMVIFFTAAIAIVKFSRRMTQYVSEDPCKPTDADDAWAMHKTPENPESYLKEEDYEGFKDFETGARPEDPGEPDDESDEFGSDEDFESGEGDDTDDDDRPDDFRPR